MPTKKAKKTEDFLPGMDEFMRQVDETWFVEGAKRETYFDSTNLPDSPGRQESVVQTHAIYLLFPGKEELIRGVNAITQGNRKGVAGKTKIVSINAMAEVPDGDGMTFLELWEMIMLGILPEEKEQSDEAQAPI